MTALLLPFRIPERDPGRVFRAAAASALCTPVVAGAIMNRGEGSGVWMDVADAMIIHTLNDDQFTSLSAPLETHLLSERFGSRLQESHDLG